VFKARVCGFADGLWTARSSRFMVYSRCSVDLWSLHGLRSVVPCGLWSLWGGGLGLVPLQGLRESRCLGLGLSRGGVPGLSRKWGLGLQVVSSRVRVSFGGLSLCGFVEGWGFMGMLRAWVRGGLGLVPGCLYLFKVGFVV
jgi:hypothetical protein